MRSKMGLKKTLDPKWDNKILVYNSSKAGVYFKLKASDTPLWVISPL